MISHTYIPIAIVLRASYELKLAMFYMLTSPDKANAHKPSSIDVEFITVYNDFYVNVRYYILWVFTFVHTLN